jgi:hypothetical protein
MEGVESSSVTRDADVKVHFQRLSYVYHVRVIVSLIIDYAVYRGRISPLMQPHCSAVEIVNFLPPYVASSSTSSDF